MLLIDITERVDVPHEPEQWIMFRKLSWRKLANARDIAQENQMDKAKKMGGELIASFTDKDSDEFKEASERVKEGSDSYEIKSYDLGTILVESIHSWSYGGDVSPDNIDLLDDVTARWAGQAALDLVKPRSEEESKKVSAVSIVP